MHGTALMIVLSVAVAIAIGVYCLANRWQRSVRVTKTEHIVFAIVCINAYMWIAINVWPFSITFAKVISAVSLVALMSIVLTQIAAKRCS